MSNNSLVLILDKLCPYAHRSWIALEEKKVNYTLKEVSLKNKQPSFTQTYKKAFGHDPSSDGKVPILVDGDQVLTESDLLVWYVAEKFDTGSALIPQPAFDRLRLRWFCSHNSKVCSSFSHLVGWNGKSQEEKKNSAKSIQDSLNELDNTLNLPFAIGQEFTIADIMIYPFIQRWQVLQELIGCDLFSHNKKINEWLKNVEQRDSIKNTRQSGNLIIDRWIPRL